jgi:hypothetical protein
MKPILRLNIDNVFIFREQNHSIIQKLYMQHGGCAPSMSDFKSILQITTQKSYNCLVIDHNKHAFQWLLADLVKSLEKKTKEICPEILNPRKKTIEIDIDEFNDMKKHLKQLKSLCSQLLDRLDIYIQ